MDEELHILPVVRRDKISHLQSYPVGAKDISVALAGVPQFDNLNIRFGQVYIRRRAFNRPWGKATDLNRQELIGGRYHRSRITEYTPYAYEEQVRKGDWQIVVHAIPRIERPKMHEVCLAETLPRLREWLLQITEAGAPGPVDRDIEQLPTRKSGGCVDTQTAEVV